MSFARPTLSELVDRLRGDIAARLPGADSLLRRSVLDVFARSFGGALAGAYSDLDWIAKQLMPDTAEDAQLARWAAMWGIARRPAISAGGRVRLTGTSGSTVLAGTRLTAAGGVTVSMVEDVTLDSGGAVVEVIAIEPGPISLPAAAPFTFLSPVLGVNAIARAEGAIVGGALEEDDEQLRARLLERLRTPPEGGARRDYLRWMKAQPGVTRAWVFPEWMGPGTVGCTFVFDGRPEPIPTPLDVETIAAALEVERPVTARVITFAPTPEPLPLAIRLSPDNAAVRAAVEAEIADLLLREAEPGGTILVSRIREAISLAPGELDHELVAPVSNVTATRGALFVPGPIEWL